MINLKDLGHMLGAANIYSFISEHRYLAQDNMVTLQDAVNIVIRSHYPTKQKVLEALFQPVQPEPEPEPEPEMPTLHELVMRIEVLEKRLRAFGL